MPGRRPEQGCAISRTPTLGILTDHEQRLSVTVPGNAELVVRSADDQMVDVEWEGRLVKMFIVDIEKRAQIVKVAGA